MNIFKKVLALSIFAGSS
jgi:hypothetical protein